MTQMQLHEWVRDNLPIEDAIRKLKSYSRDSHIPLFYPQIATVEVRPFSR